MIYCYLFNGHSWTQLKSTQQFIFPWLESKVQHTEWLSNILITLSSHNHNFDYILLGFDARDKHRMIHDLGHIFQIYILNNKIFILPLHVNVSANNLQLQLFMGKFLLAVNI